MDARKSAIFLFKTKNKFCPKNQNCQIKLKFVTETNSNMRNSMVGFTFPVLDQKYFWSNFVQKIKICQCKLKFVTETNLNMWNSMVVLTFSVLDQKYIFWGKFGPENQNLSV